MRDFESFEQGLNEEQEEIRHLQPQATCARGEMEGHKSDSRSEEVARSESSLPCASEQSYTRRRRSKKKGKNVKQPWTDKEKRKFGRLLYKFGTDFKKFMPYLKGRSFDTCKNLYTNYKYKGNQFLRYVERGQRRREQAR